MVVVEGEGKRVRGQKGEWGEGKRRSGEEATGGGSAGRKGRLVGGQKGCVGDKREGAKGAESAHRERRVQNVRVQKRWRGHKWR